MYMFEKLPNPYMLLALTLNLYSPPGAIIDVAVNWVARDGVGFPIRSANCVSSKDPASHCKLYDRIVESPLGEPGDNVLQYTVT